MIIVCRSAANDFDAMRTAQGMTNVGADVFSISHNGMHQPDGAMIQSSKFIVWAKIGSASMLKEMDEAIDKELGHAE